MVRQVVIAGIPTQIEIVDKRKLGPLFGLSLVSKRNGGFRGTIKIRRGLKGTVRRFIEEHEIFHIKDYEDNSHWLIKEIKANFAVALKEPRGFFLTTVITIFSKDRRNYYLNKILNRELSGKLS